MFYEYCLVTEVLAGEYCLFEKRAATRLLSQPLFSALCQMMLVKRNLRIIWTEQKEENLFLFCLFG